MNREHKQILHPSVFGVSVLFASIYDGLHSAQSLPAREVLLWLLIHLAAVMVLLKLFGLLAEHHHTAAQLICCASLVCGILSTLLHTLAVWGDNFPDSAIWLIGFFSLAFLARPGIHALNGAARVLRCCVIVAFVLLAAGVWRQLNWERLAFGRTIPLAGCLEFRIRPEYLAPILFSKDDVKPGVLAVLDASVRSGLCLLTELIFGAALAAQLQHGELLRAWGVGIFSRCDALLLFVWLMLAVYRVVLFSGLLRRLTAAAQRRLADET